MRKLILAVAAFVVAWLAFSLVYGLVAALLFDPVAWVTSLISSPGSYGASSTYSALGGIFILVCTLLLTRPVYRGFVRRWGGSVSG